MMQAKEAKLTPWIFVAQVSHKVMFASFHLKHHGAPLFLLCNIWWVAYVLL